MKKLLVVCILVVILSLVLPVAQSAMQPAEQFPSVSYSYRDPVCPPWPPRKYILSPDPCIGPPLPYPSTTVKG